MKIINITIMLLFVSLVAFGQKRETDKKLTPEEKVFSDIVNAVKTSQAADLVVYFASSIEFDMFEKENVYSKAQATQVMKDFFAKYKVKSFVIRHQSGKGQIKYIVGQYIAASGENIRITFFVKQSGDNFLIQQIRIENDENASA